MAERGKPLNDPRVNQLISWVLTTLCTIALSVGAWFFNGLQGNVDKLNESIVGLKISINTLSFESKRIDLLSNELQQVEKGLNRVKNEQAARTKNVYRIELIEKRLELLEQKKEKK